MSTNTKMAEPVNAVAVLRNVLNTLKHENSKPDGSISDTIWYSAYETLFDYVESSLEAIAAHDAEQAAKAVPAGMVLVPVEVLEDAATAIGHFVSDHEALDDLDAYIARHKANAAAPATPAATPSPAPAMGRDAFEAWATEYSTIPLERDDDDGLGTTGYTAMDQTMLWDAWQAAMTRAREAVGSVPVPRTWPIATSRHAWIIAQAFDDYRVAVLRALGGK